MKQSHSPARGAAILTVALLAVMGAACSNSTIQPVQSLPAAIRHTTSSPSPTPYPFTFQTVDRPNSDFNRVTGINQLGKVVGYFGQGTASDPSYGYKSEVPYTKFEPINYPGAVNTYPMGISSNRLIAGYFLSNLAGSHTFGFVKNRGLYTLYKNNKTPKGPDSVNELLGVNDSDVAVGFFTDSDGNNQPYELNVTNGSFANLTPPGFTSAEATGINGKGDVSGFGTLNDVTKAWVYKSGIYRSYGYPGAQSTTALAINWQDEVVGSYVDSDGQTHGYVSKNPTGANPTWQSVDAPKADGVTVIQCNNNHHAIAGWYIDSTGVNHGFVATVPRH